VIGFWSYTVVAELAEVPEPAAPAAVLLGLIALSAARRAGAARADPLQATHMDVGASWIVAGHAAPPEARAV